MKLPEEVIEQTTVTAEFMDEILTDCKGWVDKLLEDGEDHIMPMLHVVVWNPKTMEREHEVFGIADSFNDTIEKRAVLHGIGIRLYKEHLMPLAWFLMCEAWVSTQPPDKPRQYILPQDDPERREVAIVFGMGLNSEHVWRGATKEVKRDAENNMRPAGEWEHPVGAEYPLLTSLLRGFVSEFKGKSDVVDNILRNT